MKTIEVKRETVVKEVNTKADALFTIENLLIRDEITIEKYEVLRHMVEMLDKNNEYDLGEGLRFKLVDTVIEIKEVV